MEHFIDTVRKYPCLWNTTAIEYRDQELKDAAWAEVMKETDLTSVKEVKLKWKKLRDSYRDALKRQSEMLAKDSSGGKRSYPWKYMGQMQFLQPYMSNRKKPAEAPPPPEPPATAPSSSSSESEGEGGAGRPPRASRRRPPPDPLDLFFTGMCHSTKRLPFHAQLKIKRVVFEAVAEAEEALLAEQATYASLWARAHTASSTSDEEKPA